MKIGFISPTAGTVAGGSETIVHQFAEQLSSRHDVLVLTGRSRSKVAQKVMLDAPYEVLTVPYWPRFTPLNNLATKLISRLTPYKTESFSFYYSVLMRSAIKQRIRELDVISTHYWLDSRLFSNLAYKLGTASVFHILGGPYTKEYFEADKSTMYVATSKTTQKLINDAHDFNIESVVTPGIPSSVFPKRDIERYKLENETPLLLFLGRLQESKGLFEILEIFRILEPAHPGLKLNIVGEGNISNELSERIAKEGLSGKVILKGAVPYHEVFQYYTSSTVFVFPSKSETFGMVCLEAMACGLPVVASDIPALRESTGGNAILLPPEDIDRWVDAIKDLLAHRKRRKELSVKGIRWAKNFTWEKKAEEYEAALIKATELFKRTRKVSLSETG